MKIYVKRENDKQYKMFGSSFYGINEHTSKTIKAGKIIKSPYTKEQWVIDKVHFDKDLRFYLTKIK